MSLVEVSDMSFHYPRARLGANDEGWTLKNISLDVRRQSTLGVVGESGSGKSTLVRVMSGLLRHQRGTVRFDGSDISELKGRDALELHRSNQIVFQNPRRSLDPRMTVRRSLSRRTSRPLQMCRRNCTSNAARCPSRTIIVSGHSRWNRRMRRWTPARRRSRA